MDRENGESASVECIVECAGAEIHRVKITELSVGLDPYHGKQVLPKQMVWIGEV